MRRALASAAGCLLALSVLAAPPRTPVASAEPPPAQAPWEREVEQESAELDRQRDEAKQRNAMGAVVRKYASRASRDPSALSRFLLGRALYHNGDPAGAATQMRLALEANPGFYPAHVKLAVLQIDLKAYAEAEANLLAALRAKPGYPEANRLLVRIALDTKDWEKARRRLEDMLSLSPTDADVRQNLTFVLMQLKDWDAAIRELRVLLLRDPSNVELRFALADALREKGALSEAAQLLETLSKDPPQTLRALDRLRGVAARMGDWERVRTVLERMLPLLPEDKRKAVAEMVEELRRGPPRETAAAPPRLTWEDVFARCRDPEPAVRREALAAIYAGAAAGELAKVPGAILRRITSDVEPDAACRAWVVKVLGRLAVEVLPLVSVALYDEDRDVRLLATETLGDMRQAAGLAYLYPFLATAGLDLAELGAVREALSRITGFRDLAAGATIATEDEAAAVREAWRRWRLSDESREAKLAAVRQLLAIPEPTRERYLYDFALDPSFDVMREAYLGMRAAVERATDDPVDKKLFPRFPRVADEGVTRAAMREIQQRVADWWGEWLAERRALAKARK